MRVALKRRQEQAVAAWAGGATTELCICPETATCTGRDFAFRLSSASVELAESTFSDFSGYVRHIMPLEGHMELWHDGTFAVNLQPYEAHTFDGSAQTRSLGTCVDFNLIHKPELRGALQVVRTGGAFALGVEVTGIYARCNGLVVEGTGFSYTLEAGDFLLLDGSHAAVAEFIRLDVAAPASTETVLAVLATVQSATL